MTRYTVTLNAKSTKRFSVIAKNTAELDNSIDWLIRKTDMIRFEQEDVDSLEVDAAPEEQNAPGESLLIDELTKIFSASGADTDRPGTDKSI